MKSIADIREARQNYVYYNGTTKCTYGLDVMAVRKQFDNNSKEEIQSWTPQSETSNPET